MGGLLTLPYAGRVALLVAAGVVALGIGFHRPRALIVGVMLFLPAMGLLRRVFDQAFTPATYDLILLVVPAATVILLIAAKSALAQKRTTLTTSVLVLNVLILASSLNPLQGNLSVGLSGVLLVLVPTLWFWIGRAWIDDRLLGTLFKVILFAAVASAIYGLVQTYVGFPPYDRAWIEESGYTALNVGGTIRPFGPFSSSSEYGSYLAIGLLIVFFGIGRLQWFAKLAVGVLLFVALVLVSSRGIVVLCLVAIVGVVAARHRFHPLKAGVLVGFVLLALFLGLQSIGFGPIQDEKIGALVEHQITGLARPLDSEVSTLGQHFDLLASGLVEAFRSPVGHGVGAVTIASSKFGGNRGSTEVDFSNVAVALGLPGLCVFLIIVSQGLLSGYRRAAWKRDAVALTSLGILLATAFQWLNGGQYAVAPLPWIVLGWLDKRSRSAPPESFGQLLRPREAVHGTRIVNVGEVNTSQTDDAQPSRS